METGILNEQSVSRNGGKRPGAGRKEGSKNKATIEKKIVEDAFKQRVLKSADKLLNAQMNLAEGVQYLYRIDKTKIIGPKGGVSYRPEKPVLVTSPIEIENYLAGLTEDGDAQDENDPEAAYYFLTTEKPDNRALDSLFDRVFGKVPQRIADFEGKKLVIGFDPVFDATTRETKEDSTE